MKDGIKISAFGEIDRTSTRWVGSVIESKSMSLLAFPEDNVEVELKSVPTSTTWRRLETDIEYPDTLEDRVTKCVPWSKILEIANSGKATGDDEALSVFARWLPYVRLGQQMVAVDLAAAASPTTEGRTHVLRLMRLAENPRLARFVAPKIHENWRWPEGCEACEDYPFKMSSDLKLNKKWNMMAVTIDVTKISLWQMHLRLVYSLLQKDRLFDEPFVGTALEVVVAAVMEVHRHRVNDERWVWFAAYERWYLLESKQQDDAEKFYLSAEWQTSKTKKYFESYTLDVDRLLAGSEWRQH